MTNEQSRGNSGPVLDRLGQLARRHFDGTSPADEHADARKRIRAGFEAARGGHWLARSRQRWMWATSFAMVGIAIAFLVVRFYGPWRRLTYTVDPGTSSDGQYVGVPEDGETAALHFSDGSEVRIAPGGKLRVGELHRDGARVALQEGTASLRVVHRGKTRWAVDAGPFVVEVTGTSFDVRWSGRDEVFDLTLRTGSVIVRGPLTGEGLRLESGHRLRVSLLDGQLEVEPMLLGAGAERTRSSTAASGAGPEGAALRPDQDPRVTPDPMSPKSTPPGSSATEGSRPTWSKRVVAGDYAAVLAEAQSGGLEATLAQRPLADLAALSDAARYLERVEVAKKALLAQRSRFPGSPDAKAAAFLLGRMSQDAGDARSAIAWFTRYLAETPGAPFAAEALGRKLVAVRKVDGIEPAKPLAREYLARFPTGVHAAVAAEIARVR